MQKQFLLPLTTVLLSQTTSAVSFNSSTAPDDMQFGQVDAIYEELMNFAEIGVPSLTCAEKANAKYATKVEKCNKKKNPDKKAKCIAKQDAWLANLLPKCDCKETVKETYGAAIALCNELEGKKAKQTCKKAARAEQKKGNKACNNADPPGPPEPPGPPNPNGPVPFETSCGPIPYDTQLDADEFNMIQLTAHNDYRTLHESNVLAYSKELADYALAYAKYLDTNDKFEHAPKEDRPGQGENLYKGSYADVPTSARASNAWYAEEPDYNYTNPAEDTGVTGHFTAMIWNASCELGCGESGGVVVCRYRAPGNVQLVGDTYAYYLENVKPPAE